MTKNTFTATKNYC